jgi:hypothetical protein
MLVEARAEQFLLVVRGDDDGDGADLLPLGPGGRVGLDDVNTSS